MVQCHLALDSHPNKMWRALKMGGRDPHDNTLGANEFFLTRDDKPYFLVSGEFHYARYPERFWQEELLKIKGCGVNTVASYVFWMYHEEQQGVFDWRGNKNLRHFVELCAQTGLYFVLRVGPFSHGEWRNGGLPNWLYGQPFEVRSNDAGYLKLVERFYAEIYAQVRGLFFADGGPIIGIQIENEYMHAGAPWEIEPYAETEWISRGREGAAHLKELKQRAEGVGLIAPYYFATAWGGAAVIEEETLPVYSYYAYPTWIDAPAPSDAYLFRNKHAQPVDEPTHRRLAYPFLMAEQQGGIQVRYNNRPIVPARSTEAMTLVNLGSGSNGIGYYMFHGGTTPRGQSGFLNERLHPQLSYDFQAPLGEYGQERDSYRSLKLLHLFLETYGEQLATMQTVLPQNAAFLTPTDLTTPRFCVRADRASGFLFVNNFQDHLSTCDIENVSFVLQDASDTVTFPPLTIQHDTCFILPFGESIAGARLRYATAQPLTRVYAADYVHYFYFAPESVTPEFCFDAQTIGNVHGEIEKCETRDNQLFIQPGVGQEKSFAFTTAENVNVVITTLTRAEAEHTWKGNAWGSERVVICNPPLTFEGGAVTLTPLGVSQIDLMVYPPVTTQVNSLEAQVRVETLAQFTRFHVTAPACSVPVNIERVTKYKYALQFVPDALRGLNDLFLCIEYDGDTALAFLDGELVADNFCNGLAWEIGLKRFAPRVFEVGLVLVFRPLRRGALKNVSSQNAARFEFQGDEKLVIHSITALPEYRVRLIHE